MKKWSKVQNNIFFSYFQVPLRPPTASSNASSTSRPSLALSHKMKGFRKDMQQKISRLRSRSAERISKRLQNRSSDRHDVSIRWANCFVYLSFLVRCQNEITCFRNPFQNANFLYLWDDDVSKDTFQLTYLSSYFIQYIIINIIRSIVL